MHSINQKIVFQLKDYKTTDIAQKICDLAFHFLDENYNSDTVEYDYNKHTVTCNVSLGNGLNGGKVQSMTRLFMDLNLSANADDLKTEED